jgi:hypothetical protein
MRRFVPNAHGAQSARDDAIDPVGIADDVVQMSRMTPNDSDLAPLADNLRGRLKR